MNSRPLSCFPAGKHCWSYLLGSYPAFSVTLPGLVLWTAPKGYSPLPNTDSPWFKIVNLKFFDFTMVWKWYAFKKLYLEFWILIISQASDTWYNILLWCWAAAVTTAPSLPWDQQGEQPIGCSNRNHSTNRNLQPLIPQTTILFFIFSIVFNRLHEIFNILLYNRFCVGWFFPIVCCYKCSEHVEGGLG